MKQPSTATLIKHTLIHLSHSRELIDMDRSIGNYGIESRSLKHHLEMQFNIALGDRRFCYQTGNDIVVIIDDAIAAQHEYLATPEATAIIREVLHLSGKSKVQHWPSNRPINNAIPKMSGYRGDVLIMDDLTESSDYTATQIGLAKDKQIRDIIQDCIEDIRQEVIPPALLKGVLEVLQRKGYLPPVI